MMADPAFLQKMLMEQAITVGSSVWWEAEQRGDRFSQELDLVAINTLSLCAANAALVWMVSADRSFGAPNRMPWQKLLHSLPNNMFDRCALFPLDTPADLSCATCHVSLKPRRILAERWDINA